MASRSSLYRSAPTNLPTVVVKRRRRDAPQTSHNGAWKVAYADFVTAMMSLFLLLWLLSSTTSSQRQAISTYFEQSQVSDSENGAGGVLGGKSIIEPGAQIQSEVATGVHVPLPGAPDVTRPGEAKNDPSSKKTDAAEEGGGKAVAEREDRNFKEAEASLKQAIQSVPELQPLARNLIVDQTPEGMRIQLVDQDGAAMFPLGSADMFEQTRKLLTVIEQSVVALPNKISIRGHTDANPYKGGSDHYNNWDLSSDRANASRRALEAAGLSPARIQEVIGKADKDPLFPDRPLSAQNRRISIVLLRQAAPARPATP